MKAPNSFDKIIKIISGIILTLALLLNFLAWDLNAGGFPFAHSYWLNSSGQRIDVGFDAGHTGLTRHNNFAIFFLDLVVLIIVTFMLYELMILTVKLLNKFAAK